MRKPTIQKNLQVSYTAQLPIPGKVMVHLGQVIEKDSLIAEANLPARFQVFDVLNQFRIDPGELEGCMKRLAGEEVQKGDVIARKPGLLSRIFRAPEAGKVVSVHDGRVTLAMGEKKVQSSSPIPGVVAEIVPGLGAQIVAHGEGIQAAWGNGKIASGVLVEAQDLQKTEKQDLTEKIVVVVEPLSRELMDYLAEAKVAGAVCAALDPLRQAEFSAWQVPLLCLAGFGEAVFDAVSKAVLDGFQGKTVCLVGVGRPVSGSQKPCLFVPRTESHPAELFSDEPDTLLGCQVRFLGMPYFGSLGEVIEIPDEEERLGSGVLSQVVVVKRADDSIIRVPLGNLEILSG